jgi:HSP20 family protein
MTMRDLIPWARARTAPASRFEDEGGSLFALHREMNRLFDDFFRSFDLPLPARFGWSGGWPHVEVSETEKEVKVAAELPGLDEKDVEVMLQEGALTLKGEKHSGSEGASYSERWAGRLMRWTGNDDPLASLRPGFPDLGTAERYARHQGYAIAS